MSRKDHEKQFRVAVGAEPVDRAISPLRADLRISPQLYYGQLCFVIKDPVTLRYFRLAPVEHYLVTQLDGKRTARDLLGIIQQRFPESALGVQEVLRFVGMLHESHLLLGEGQAHASWLSKQAGVSRRRRMLQLLQNFLFIKVPLFNPEKVLTVLEASVGRLIFQPLTGVVALLLVVAALGEVLAHTDRLLHLPYNLLSVQNLAVLYGVYIVTKMFHEFGHGLTTKHHGGEVSNMGVMLFVFTPSFYCDTSDAWMIPSHAARLWINAGGVVVELVLAALATFVWVYTQEDTLLNQIAMNVMISCSVATLFFNANPLLRYDGYYFLADYLEIPNLMSKGREFLKYFVQKHILGLKPSLPPDATRLTPLLTYAVASSVYRWLVMFGIIMLLCYFFDRYEMGPIGVMLATAYVLATVLIPAWQASKFLWKQRWDVSKRVGYIGIAGAGAIGVLALVALVPWSHTIREPLVVLSERDEPIVVRTPGYVEAVEADMGERVSQGAVLVRIKDPSLQTQLERAVSKRDEARIGVTSARAESKPGAMAAAQTAVDAYDKQIALLQQRVEDLVLRAPLAGVVMRETPLKRLVGNYVPPGMKLCRVIQTDRLQARITLPQQQAALVKEGMAVRMRLWSRPGEMIEAPVTRISGAVTEQLLHPALASTVKGDVAVTADPHGQVKSVGKRSTVVIDLPAALQEEMFVADGMTGRGEIVVQKTRVVGRIWRMLLDATTPDWHL